MKTIRRMHKHEPWAPIVGLTGALLLAACGDDDSPSPQAPADESSDDTRDRDDTGEESQPSTNASSEASTGGTSGRGSTTVVDAGPDDGGAVEIDAAGDTSQQDGGTGVTDEAKSWIVGGWLLTEDGYFGYLTILDDLSESGEIDLSKVHTFAGDITYVSNGKGAVYVGQEGLSTVERWIVNEAGTRIEKDGEINFEYFGVTRTTGNGAIQLIDDETAWFFDTKTFQVIVFNPSTMTTEGETIDFSGLLEQDYDLVPGNVSRLGNKLVISAQYWDADGNAVSLTRAALVDTESHEVDYADDTRCGSTRFHVLDEAGNLYIGAHPGESLWRAAGLGTDNSPAPCIVRIKLDQTEFDDDYYVNLEEVSGGKVVGGFMQGDGKHAYVYEFTGNAGEITADNYNGQLRGDNWALARIQLGNEAKSYTLVGDYEPSTAYGSSFSVVVGKAARRYVISANASFASGRYYDLTQPTKAVEALSFPGFPGEALNY